MTDDDTPSDWENRHDWQTDISDDIEYGGEHRQYACPECGQPPYILAYSDRDVHLACPDCKLQSWTY